MSSKETLTVRPATIQIVMHLIAAAGLLFATALLYKKEDPFLTIIFSIVAGINLLLAILTTRMYVTITDDTLERQEYFTKKSMKISELTMANLWGGRGGNTIELHNKQGQRIIFHVMFSKSDLTKLAARLRPYITAPGVKRNPIIEKFLSKNSTKAKARFTEY